MQGRNPLPKEAFSTNFLWIQTNPEEIVVEEVVAQNEEVIPLETQEMMKSIETIKNLISNQKDGKITTMTNIIQAPNQAQRKQIFSNEMPS